MNYLLGLAPVLKYGGLHVRIGENARKCVVFFGVETEKGIEYGGTGFLVLDQERGVSIPFLVTCRHVAAHLSKFEQFFLRINTKDGGSKDLPIEGADWSYPEDRSVDLAAVVFGFPSDSPYDVTHYRLADDTVVSTKPFSLMTGDVVSIAGLFRLHSGRQRSVPFVHTGNIAVIADSKELVPMRDRVTNEIIDTEAHLIEAQTLDGLSGSPAFLHETASLTGFHEIRHPVAFRGAVLLGVYSGSWDGEPGTILAADRGLRGQIRVPVGVGTVVPVPKLLSLLRDHPDMKKARTIIANDRLAKSAASQDSALPAAPPTNGGNPTHREDFMRLVDAAARKPPQED